jgi:F0F1-type ATP synthase membrane subunit b/b'
VTDLDAKVARAKADISAAQAARAKAEHQYQVAVAQAQAAAQDLREEFGAGSAAEARELTGRLERELEDECAQVRDALSRAGQETDFD